MTWSTGRGEAPTCGVFGVAMRARWSPCCSAGEARRGSACCVLAVATARRCPMRCVLAVATARQPTRDPDSMVPVCHTEGIVATTLRRRVLHGGGLFGAGPSVSFVFPIGAGWCLGGNFMCSRWLLAATAWVCSVSVGQQSGLDQIVLQSIRSGLSR